MGNEQNKINEFNNISNADFLNEINNKNNNEENKELTNKCISIVSDLCNSCLINDNNLKVENNISSLFNPYMDIRNSDKLIGKKEESYLVESNLNYYSWFQYYNKIENFEKIKSNIAFGLFDNKINQFMKIINNDKFDNQKSFTNYSNEIDKYLKKSKSEDKIIKKDKNINKNIKKNLNKKKNTKLISIKNNNNGNKINSSQKLIKVHHTLNKSTDTIRRNDKNKNTIIDNTLKLNDNSIKSYYSRNPSINDTKLSKHSISSILQNYSISSENSLTDFFKSKIHKPLLEKSKFFVNGEENSYVEKAKKKFEMKKKKTKKKKKKTNEKIK